MELKQASFTTYIKWNGPDIYKSNQGELKSAICSTELGITQTIYAQSQNYLTI
jgi:hypothetical protein